MKTAWAVCLSIAVGACHGEGEEPVLGERSEALTVLPYASLRPASHLPFPAEIDSNSPSVWDGNTLYQFNSAGGLIKRSHGSGIASLGNTQNTSFVTQVGQTNYWMEAVWRASDGVFWGWYHAEPWNSPCANPSNLGRTLTVPQIGAAVSYDKGSTWNDLGIVLRADPTTVNCDTANGYFGGGVGDPTVMLDSTNQYLYIFFGAYSGNVANQGVSVARMAWGDRSSPVGKVWRWHNGGWTSPGIDGTSTPTFPATTDWTHPDANAFWGASIHYNTYLGRHVVLMNRAIDGNWAQGGTYIAYSTDLANPGSWSFPSMIVDGGYWYPQVVGSSSGGYQGTDKRAGQVARYFNWGASDYEIEFSTAPKCTLTADSDHRTSADNYEFVAGETPHYTVVANASGTPQGYSVYWHGTHDGVVDAIDVHFGNASLFDLSYGPLTEDLIPGASSSTTFTRYFVARDDAGQTICTSNPITILLRRTPPAPPPEIYGGGWGCEDGLCAWFFVDTLMADTYFDVRRAFYGDVIGQYFPSQQWRDPSNPDWVAFRLDDPSLQNWFVTEGLRFWAVNPSSGNWSNDWFIQSPGP